MVNRGSSIARLTGVIGQGHCIWYGFKDNRIVGDEIAMPNIYWRTLCIFTIRYHRKTRVKETVEISNILNYAVVFCCTCDLDLWPVVIATETITSVIAPLDNRACEEGVGKIVVLECAELVVHTTVGQIIKKIVQFLVAVFRFWLLQNSKTESRSSHLFSMLYSISIAFS